MRIGYGSWGSGAVAADEHGWKRSFAVLIAFLVGAVLAVGMALPADAHGWTKNASVTTEAGCAVEFASYPGSVDVSIANQANQKLKVTQVTILPVNAAVPTSNSWVWPGNSETYTAGDLPNGSYTAHVEVKWYYGGTTAYDVGFSVDCNTVLQCGESECASFTDPDGAWSASCTGCTNQVIIRQEGANEVADLEITQESKFKLVLTTTGKGPNPLKAFVTLVDTGERVPRCGVLIVTQLLAGAWPKVENCVFIYKVGVKTRYVLLWDQDPRFKFG